MDDEEEGRFLWPPLQALAALEHVSPELARRFLEEWIDSKAVYAQALADRIADAIESSRHHRRYRTTSIWLGTVLAALSLAVGAYGIYAQANLLHIAALLAPVSGVAGVFIWGYRPNGG